MRDRPKIIITGGGTGGHVFPALSIAEELRSRGFSILYVGSDRGLEAKLAPPKNIPFVAVHTGGVKNQSMVHRVKSIIRLFFAVLWSIKLLRKESPVAVVGVGGYISVPICVAAFLSRIPLYLQEQNASVGIANRFLGKLAHKIFLGFEEGKSFLPKDRCVTTGNPLRSVFFETDFSYPKDPALLVFGGSQGAKAINNAMKELYQKIRSKYPQLKILHQTGQSDFEEVSRFYQSKNDSFVRCQAFIEDMASEYQKAGVVVARSGALTVSELVQVGRPAVLVPYPRKGQNDQTANAYMLENQGVAKVVEQGEDFPNRLWLALDEMVCRSRTEAGRAAWQKKFSLLRPPNALATIGAHIAGDVLGKNPNEEAQKAPQKR